jgi:hypothetical protein
MQALAQGWAEKYVAEAYQGGLADVDGWLMQRCHASAYKRLRREGLTHMQAVERLYRETGMGVGGLSKAAHPGMITPMDLGFTRMHSRAIEHVTRSVLTSLNYANGGVARSVEDIFRKAQLQTVRDAYLMGDTERALSKKLAKDLTDVYGPKIRNAIEDMEKQGLRPKAIMRELEKRGLVSGRMRQGLVQRLQKTGQGTSADLVGYLRRNAGTEFVDKLGRRWDLGRYTDMVARTTTREASRLGRWGRCMDVGCDTVMVRGVSVWPESPCIQYEGEILSLTGKSPYTTVATATANGLFHPCCVHSTSAYIVDRQAYINGMLDRWQSGGNVVDAEDRFANLTKQVVRPAAATAGEIGAGV